MLAVEVHLFNAVVLSPEGESVERNLERLLF